MLEGTTPIETPKQHFKDFDDARKWAEQNIAGTYKNEYTGEDIRISNKAIGKYLNESAVKKSPNEDIHKSALAKLPELIKTAILKERHPDKRNSENIEEIQLLYSSIRYENRVYPVKLTIKVYSKKLKEVSKAYSYEVIDIETPTANGQGFNNNSLGLNERIQSTDRPDFLLNADSHSSPFARQSVAEQGSTTYTDKGTTNNSNNQTFNEKVLLVNSTTN
jgi:hypothetical protein